MEAHGQITSMRVGVMRWENFWKVTCTSVSVPK
jgi:hypothetical protein